MIAKPDETYSDDLYRFAWPDGIEMILERFHEIRDDIACELTVRSSHPTKGGTLVDGKRLLLIGPNSQRDMARTLMGRDETPDWAGMLEQVTTLSRRRYRRGEPPTDLRDQSGTTDGRYLVHPLLIEGGTTIWYGSEESAKSMLAMTAAAVVASGSEIAGLVAERTGPVVYLDWEDDAGTHQERLRAICEAAGVPVPPVWHQRMTQSLQAAVKDVRRLVAELGAVLVIIDSIGMASGGDPADAGGIISTMTAARALGVAVLGIHHLPKESKDKSRPYGSVYAAAESRMTWLVEKDEDATPGTTRIALTNKKSNRSQRHGRRSFEFTFESDIDRENLLRVDVRPISFTDSVSIGTGAGQKWRIRDVLKAGPKTAREISAETDITVAVVGAQLRRHTEMFVKSGTDGAWELVPLATAESANEQSRTVVEQRSGGERAVPPPLGGVLGPDIDEETEEEWSPF